jgi:ankyrin repeat protein
MKHILITTIAAVLLVGCGKSQQSAPPAEAKPAEPVAEAAQPKPTTPKAPDISIHDAAHTGNIEAVKKHLDAGTDVNAKDEDGYTPLYAVAGGGHNEIAELLISKGADVNAKDKDGWTPLHEATMGGHKEVAELLIVKGADVNAKEEFDGWTPLHFVAGKGHKETARLLITKGADVNAKDEGGNTPLDGAEEVSKDGSPEDKAAKKETAALLRKHGGKTGEKLKAEGK